MPILKPGRIAGPFTTSPNIYRHHNGICTDGLFFYAIDNGLITKYDLDWNQVAENSVAGTDAGCQHLGGGTVYNGVLYVSGENYTNPTTYSLQRIARFRTSDLSFIGFTDISAQGNEVSGLGIDVVARRIYISSFVQSQALYIYDLDTFAYIGDFKITGIPALSEAQDVTVSPYDRTFFITVSGGVVQDKVFVVNRLGHVVDSFIPYKYGGCEGIDFYGDTLFVHDENTSTNVTYIHYYKYINERLAKTSNLIRNGSFDFVPKFLAAQTVNGTIDGSAGGGANKLDATRRLFQWGANVYQTTSPQIKYDTINQKSGRACMSLSGSAIKERINLTLGMRPFSNLDDPSDIFNNLIPIKPLTNYRLTLVAKHSVANSVGSPVGFRSRIREHTGIAAINALLVAQQASAFDWTTFTYDFLSHKASRYFNIEIGIFGDASNYYDGVLLINDVILQEL